MTDLKTAVWDEAIERKIAVTNCFHKYPAMMVPSVVDRILAEYGCKGGNLLDPFCGTGRALVGGHLFGMAVFGLDVNPLAVLVSKVKLTRLDKDELLAGLLAVEDGCDHSQRSTVPMFYNRDYWFDATVVEGLWRLLCAIDQCCIEAEIRDFFYVVFSEVVKDLSLASKSEYKLYRVYSRREVEFSEVWSCFRRKAHRNIAGMGEFSDLSPKHGPGFELVREDARQLSARTFKMLDTHVDIVLTSPPYGDSRTTVDYGNFSRHSLQWLCLSSTFCSRWGLSSEADILHLNAAMLGGGHGRGLPLCSLAREAISSVEMVDVGRGKSVERFLCDLKESVDASTRLLKPEGVLAIIIGDRTVSGIKIPTGAIIAQCLAETGWMLVSRVSRTIKGKRVPQKVRVEDGPEGMRGTIIEEAVLVFRRG